MDDDLAGLNPRDGVDAGFRSPFDTALDAIMSGRGHPGYSDPLARPWIDLMASQDQRPQRGLLGGGLELLATEKRQNPGAVALDTSTDASRFTPTTINGVDGLNFRVMTPAETGASSVGDPNVVTNSLSRLPRHVLTNLRDKGVRWIVTSDSADQGMPQANLTSKTPDGWPKYRNPQNPDSKLDWGDASSITISPTAKDLPLRNVVIIGTNSPDGDGSHNVTLHETGHAHDFNNGMLSASPAFGGAYLADVPNMTTDAEATPQDAPDSYYLQRSDEQNADRARREAYAESFARYYGGDDTLQTDWPAMYQYWQRFDAGQRNAARSVHSGGGR